MAKDTYYFQHDYNARNDDKVLEMRQKFGAEGYGIFWMLLETMAENENGLINSKLLGGLSLNYGIPTQKLKAVIDECVRVKLFQKKGTNYFSKRILTYKQLRKKISEDGKNAAKIRWQSR